MFTQLFLPTDFSPEDLMEVAGRLEDESPCVPGYIPPDDGLYDLGTFLHAVHVDEIETVLLPDRNLVSRWVQAISGHTPLSRQHKQAAELMAFCQCLNIEIEPSIASHELAEAQGVEVAADELAWFRAADRHAAQRWLDMALSRVDRLDAAPGQRREVSELSTPLRRWRRNYILTLKIAELELLPMKPKERVRTFFDWMYDDFILGGPSALLALVYLAPLEAPRKRLFKGLRSSDRERALLGIRNATWDITYLSDFIERVRSTPYEQKRFIFATFDDGIRRIAGLAFGRDELQSEEDRLSEDLASWWPIADARELVTLLSGHYARARSPEWHHAQTLAVGHIDAFIERGEALVRAGAF